MQRLNHDTRKLIYFLEPFITTASPLQLLVLVTSRIEELARRALSGSPPPLNLFSPPIKILAHYVTISTNALAVADSEIFAGGVTAMGQVAHLLPHSRIGDLGEVVDIAESAWNAIVVAGGQKVVAAILIALQEQVLDVESHPSFVIPFPYFSFVTN